MYIHEIKIDKTQIPDGPETAKVRISKTVFEMLTSPQREIYARSLKNALYADDLERRGEK